MYKRNYFISLLPVILLCFFTFSFLPGCFRAPSDPVLTRAPRKTGTPSTFSIPTPSTQTTVTPSVTSKTTRAPSDSTIPEIPLYLVSTPTYDASEKGFCCYFTDDFTYSFSESDVCTLTITEKSGDSVRMYAKIDLSLGVFMEEGLFTGVGFTTDYSFTSNTNYNISVTIKSSDCVYTFNFDYSK